MWILSSYGRHIRIPDGRHIIRHAICKTHGGHLETQYDVNSQIAKMYMDIENIQVGIDTCILVLGAIEQEIWAKLWAWWRHIGNQYGGHQGSQVFGVYFYNI